MIYNQSGIVIFDLKYCCPKEKMEIYERYEEDYWEKVNQLLLPKESMPAVKIKLKTVADDIHRIVHKMKEDDRDSFGTELDQMSGKLYEDFLMMSNGWEDKAAFFEKAGERLQRIKAKIGTITELRLVDSGKVFVILKDVEKAIKQIEIERKLADVDNIRKQLRTTIEQIVSSIFGSQKR